MTLTTAYGGVNWSPRTLPMREDMSEHWGNWGSSSEYEKLRSVLLKRPGSELDGIDDFDAMQMREDLDPDRARQQHDGMADAFESNGVAVYYVESSRTDKPNAMFMRDLMLMTPEGAIITRPASTVRAGEERFVSEALGKLGVPILMTVHGSGTFEGADVIWIDDELCFLAEGLRTNREGADQVEHMLMEIGVPEVVRVQLPWGSMHLDGLLNIISSEIAVAWPHRTPLSIVRKLEERGYTILPVLDDVEAQKNLPLNFVTLEPGKILMPTGGGEMRLQYEEFGIECIEIQVDELIKAGGGIHCMTGFLHRSSSN